MSLWTSAEAAVATGGQVGSEWQASGVSIDTRSLAPGDLFVALTDVRDGHDFVPQALEKGACAALASRVPEGVDPAQLLLVDAVLPALERLGAAARARTSARVIAVTGSVGKTSTKEMLRTVLEAQGRTHASVESYNNHWGVPLTLARMPADTEFAVIEIGMNHPGEIAPLSRLTRPHVAMITNIAEVHTEFFEDGLEGIAREKLSIEAGLDDGDDGSALVWCCDIAEEAYKVLDWHRQIKTRTFHYGSQDDNPWHLTDVRVGDESTVVAAQTPSGPVRFTLSAPGKHFAINALGVLAAVEALGADPGRAAVDLALWQPPKGRGMRQRRLLDPYDLASGFDLIDDAFNASPTSLAAALEVFAAAQPQGRRGRRVAILGDMLELGPEETRIHADIAALAPMEAVHQVHCVGPRMQALYEALPAEKRGLWGATAPELADQASALVGAGDVVLVKGSKGSKVSLLVDVLRKLSHPLPQDEAPKTASRVEDRD